MRVLLEILTCLACNAVCLLLLYIGKYFSHSVEEGENKGEAEGENERNKRIKFQFSDDRIINCLVWAGGIFIQAAVVWKAAAGEADALSGAAFIVLAVWLFYIAMIDTKARIIPNRMLLGMLAARVILWIWQCVRDGLPEKGNVLYQIIYSVIILVFLLFVVMVSKNGFGYGDVKLLTALSFFMDYGFLLSALLTALLGALGVSVYLLMVKKRDRKASIPFGPFFYFGYIINVLIML